MQEARLTMKPSATGNTADGSGLEREAELLERIARLEQRLDGLPDQLHGVWMKDLQRLQGQYRAHMETVEARVVQAVSELRARADDLALSASVPDALYAALEDRFRGSREDIHHRQTSYVADVQATPGPGPILDLGCGRGEFLAVLAEHGIEAIGVDASAAAVAACTEAGLDARQGDLVDDLADRADGSVRAVSMLQVVEHLPFELLLHVLAEVRRVLQPGGLFIAETPNAANVTVAATTFLARSDPPTATPPPPVGLPRRAIRFRSHRAPQLRPPDAALAARER